MKALFVPVLALMLLGAAPVEPKPSLGKAEAACRTNETGPALMITATGLKDRKGLLRAELYPNNDSDFLEDDAVLVNAGKTFRRIDLALTTSNDPTLCMRVPSAGKYTLSLLHDRDRNLKFGFTSDGIGFSNNPKLARSKPKASSATITASSGITRILIRINYRTGLISFGPLKSK